MPDLTALFTGNLLLKIGFLILDGFLIIFLIVVNQQADAMRRVINDDGASRLINLVSLANIIVAIIIFVAALILL